MGIKDTITLPQPEEIRLQLSPVSQGIGQTTATLATAQQAAALQTGPTEVTEEQEQRPATAAEGKP